LLRTGFDNEARSKVKWAKNLERECKKALGLVMPIKKSEKEFLNRLLDHGEIIPEFLTKDEGLLERLKSHPGLKWKALNVRKHKGKV